MKRWGLDKSKNQPRFKLPQKREDRHLHVSHDGQVKESIISDETSDVEDVPTQVVDDQRKVPLLIQENNDDKLKYLFEAMTRNTEYEGLGRFLIQALDDYHHGEVIKPEDEIKDESAEKSQEDENIDESQPEITSPSWVVEESSPKIRLTRRVRSQAKE